MYKHAQLTGDSLKLSRMAAETNAEHIVFCGVHFMAEVADIVTYGERIHVLPESEFVMRKGDVVVQLAHFHSWDSTRGDNIMIFDMIGGEYPHDEKA